MSRIRCSPCEIIVPVCDCCTEELCYCSKNSVQLSCAPCICNPRGPYVGAKVPLLVEGWVADDGYPLATSNYTTPGPPFSSLVTCSWDPDMNLFEYTKKTFRGSTFINQMASLNAGFNPSAFGIFPGFNNHLAGTANVLVNQLLSRNFVSEIFKPYNAQLFYILRNKVSQVYNSLSPQAKTFIGDLQHKSPTSYYFGDLYLNQLAKSLLIGKMDNYFESDKMDYILSSSENLYSGRSVPEISNLFDTNLENAKEYIRENRISISPHIIDGHLNQSVPDNTLRKFWKVLPSDTDQRIRVYRTPQVVRYIRQKVAHGGGGGNVVTATNVSPCSIMSVKVNDDDTITVHTLPRPAPPFPATPAGTARVHYINAETLRVFNNSGAYVYLDDTPRFQTGCECLSGCNPKICSDRDKAYVFDPQDRSVLLGLLGGVSGMRSRWSPDVPATEITISSTFEDEIEFKQGASKATYAYGAATNTSAWSDFYLLTPSLNGVDTVSSIIPSGFNASSYGGLSGPHTNPYIRKSEISYKVRSGNYSHVESGVIEEYIRFVAGPGNIFFVDHNDPIVSYLNRAGSTQQDVSASLVDLNIDNILEETEVYPRRVPYHIVIITTDSRSKWNPYASKSRITDLRDMQDNGGVTGYIQRTLRMVPSPRKDVLEYNYLELSSLRDVPPGLYPPTESEKFPNGVEGIENAPQQMVWKARNRNGLGPTQSANASSIQGTIRTFADPGAYEQSREIDPIRRVFDFLTDVSANYDTRTDIAFQNGELVPRSIIYNTPHPVLRAKSLPKFDVWRHLSIFEFNEFLLSFKNNFFNSSTSGLAIGRFRGLELFNTFTYFPEKTYLHTYAPAYSWPWSVTGQYGGNSHNLRNASGIDVFEAPRTSLNKEGNVMTDRDPRNFY